MLSDWFHKTSPSHSPVRRFDRAVHALREEIDELEFLEGKGAAESRQKSADDHDEAELAVGGREVGLPMDDLVLREKAGLLRDRGRGTLVTRMQERCGIRAVHSVGGRFGSAQRLNCDRTTPDRSPENPRSLR